MKIRFLRYPFMKRKELHVQISIDVKKDQYFYIVHHEKKICKYTYTYTYAKGSHFLDSPLKKDTYMYTYI